MTWLPLASDQDLAAAVAESYRHPVLIFKHSTRCNISTMALSRFERTYKADAAGGLKPYLLDLLRHRGLSAAVATETGIVHESPQVILLRDGKAVHHASHMAISFDKVRGIL